MTSLVKFLARRGSLSASLLVAGAIAVGCGKRSSQPAAPVALPRTSDTAAVSPPPSAREATPDVAQAAGEPPAAPPPVHGTIAQAKSMLAKVAARVKAIGRQRAFFEFTARRPPFFEGDLYVVCLDERRVVVAHGGFPTYVGSGDFFKDADGRRLASVIWEALKNGADTVRYTIKDDETNNVAEPKIGFFRRIKSDVCGVIAHDDSPPRTL